MSNEYFDHLRVAGYIFDYYWVVQVMRHRLYQHRRAGDAAGARAAAELCETIIPHVPEYHHALHQYNSACCRAVAADLYAKAGQAAEATADADRAMA